MLLFIPFGSFHPFSSSISIGLSHTRNIGLLFFVVFHWFCYLLFRFFFKIPKPTDTHTHTHILTGDKGIARKKTKQINPFFFSRNIWMFFLFCVSISQRHTHSHYNSIGQIECFFSFLFLFFSFKMKRDTERNRCDVTKVTEKPILMEFECVVCVVYGIFKHTNTNLLLNRVNAMFSLHQNNALGHFFSPYFSFSLTYTIVYCRCDCCHRHQMKIS